MAKLKSEDIVTHESVFKKLELFLKNLERPQYDLVRRQGTRTFDCEDEVGVVFADTDALRRQADLPSEPGALLAERALISILDLHCLLQLVDAKDFARALFDELPFLLLCESPVDDFLVDANDWLLTHGTGGDRRPLRMRLANTLLCNHGKVELLVLAEHHEPDRVALLPILFVVDDRDDSAIDVASDDVL